jgi:4-hydroxy-tetrahydrodipicolinate synthase
MSNMIRQQALRGIIPPMVTPLVDTDTLDEKGVEKLVEHLIRGGVSGIFILGTTGEAQHLSLKVKENLIRKTSSCINGRIPLLVGITDTSLFDSLYIAEIAEECNAAAVVATPPYFFALGQSEVAEYYEALADRSPLPLFLYNMPSHTKTMIEPEVVKVLSQHPNIIGLKDSSANGVYFCKLLDMFSSHPTFSLYVGPEEMMAPMVLMGAHGGVSGGANLYPEVFVKLYQAAASGNLEEMRIQQARMIAISRELYNLSRSVSSYIKGIKTALSIKDICSDVLAKPFHRFPSRERDKVVTIIETLEKGKKSKGK